MSGKKICRKWVATRRTFLQGAGGAVLTLPHLETIASSATDSVPIRMACIGLNFGLVPHLFFPSNPEAVAALFKPAAVDAADEVA